MNGDNGAVTGIAEDRDRGGGARARGARGGGRTRRAQGDVGSIHARQDPVLMRRSKSGECRC